MEILKIAIPALILVVWYLSHVAGRLDRLHDRINSAWASLNTALARRAAAVVEIATNENLDVISRALLADSAHKTLMASDENFVLRSHLENALSEMLCDVFDEEFLVAKPHFDQEQSDSLLELAIICERLAMTKTFHDGAVFDALSLRSRFFVRLFHLFGHAKLPEYTGLDVRIPKGLARD